MSSASSSLPDALRAVLLDPADATAVEVHGRTKAAVLVALYEDDGALHAVFTRRHDDLRSHAGEISFPGGRRDDEDADLLTTALREAEEEIGLPRDAVHVLGALRPTPTVATNFGVYPFVGLIEPGREWTLSPREVDEVLELRLERPARREQPPAPAAPRHPVSQRRLRRQRGGRDLGRDGADRRRPAGARRPPPRRGERVDAPAR